MRRIESVESQAMNLIRIFFIALVALIAAPGDARALAGEWQGDGDASARLIAGVDGVGQLASIPLGLEIKLGPDWHTYWRSPGEAGLPPQIDWQKSESDGGNLKSATLLYPAPKRYTAFGLETIGYRDHVVLPIDAALRTPGKPLAIEATADVLVCSQLCVPKHFILKLNVPQGDARENTEAALLKPFRDAVPGNAEASGLSVKQVSNDGPSLTIEIASREYLQAPDVFIENDKYIEFSAPLVTIGPDHRSAQLTVKPIMPLPEGVTLSSLPLTLTVIDGAHALEQQVIAAAIPASLPVPAAPALPLSLVIIFALIGGFILNLMPCVLPVLSLKVLGVVSHGGGEARVVRHSFFVTAAGIVFSFLALAGVTILLKECGLAVGWGVQFQQPVFLGLLVLLLTFFAANMWGLFDIRLPRWLDDNLTGPYHPKLAGDFATGAFATLLATPCTAPFLGTAVGFALASGPREILIIFAALGLGMALPYLAVALIPRFATALPKPGAWMMHLRHLLAWALALTAVWLIWVLAAQISPRGAFVVGICMLAILGLFGLQRYRARSYIYFGIASFAILAFGTVLAGSLAPKPPPQIDAAWQRFDETEIAREIQEGKTVFVDVTADWCLTCKANKKFILARDEISQRLFHSDIIAMQADWTNPDPVIGVFLQKYGRYGIPFNAVFGPGAPQGLVLPELLSSEAVMAAFDKAAKSPQP